MRRLTLSDIRAIGDRISEAPTPKARRQMIIDLFKDLGRDIADGRCPKVTLYLRAARDAARRR